MPFSQATKYCIRAVLYLAEHGGEKPLMSRQIARALQVPEPFLAKILQQLSRQGILRSFKGRGGGFVLARPAREVYLAEVVETVEGPSFREGCVLGLDQCSAENPCHLHEQWGRFKEEMMEVLSRQSIEEMMRKSPGTRARTQAGPA
jgi:Rrf2 family protein